MRYGVCGGLVALCVLVVMAYGHTTDDMESKQIGCDVLIAGGSTAALAAAITAAEASPSLQVYVVSCEGGGCLLTLVSLRNMWYMLETTNS